jgi:hypothetical protein
LCEIDGYKKGKTNVCFFHPGSGMDKNQDPVSGINIPDLQHCSVIIVLVVTTHEVTTQPAYCRQGCGSGSVSGSGLDPDSIRSVDPYPDPYSEIQIRIQEGKNDPQK